MRILITGGNGYIGGRLAKRLEEDGHEIVLGVRNILISRCSTPDFERKKINWDEISSLRNACSRAEVVIHTAGVNSVACLHDPVAALMFNGVATARLVAAACQEYVPRFIYLSTAHVYGDPLAGTILENTCPKNLHPYATSHLAGEYALIGAGRRAEIQANVLRLTNIFGAPANKFVNCWSLLVNSMCRDAIELGRFRLKTRGLQHRSFVPMEDFCNFVVSLINDINSKSHPEIINVGPDKSQSVLSMTNKIQERCLTLFGLKINLESDKSQVDNPGESFVCRSTLCDKLGLIINASSERREIDSLLKYCMKEFGFKKPST